MLRHVRGSVVLLCAWLVACSSSHATPSDAGADAFAGIDGGSGSDASVDAPLDAPSDGVALSYADGGYCDRPGRSSVTRPRSRPSGIF